MSGITRRIRISAELSVLFLVVYGFCNRITAYRSGVHSFYFGWERHIQFVPALILPYLSIDLFFVAAPFLLRTDQELRIFSWRVIMAITVAGACFSFVPLRFAFDRPAVHGWIGVAFDGFQHIDLPYNQFPSLHAAFWLILLDVYLKRLHGLARWAVTGWFVLIILSTVLTYQHHVIDIIGGLALGVICMYLFHDVPIRQPLVPNLRIAISYAIGCAALLLLSLCWQPWSCLLCWPTMSLGLTALGYIWLGSGIFHKRRGSLAVSTWIMLWPILLGQRISWLFYARRCTAVDRVTDNFWIGRTLTVTEAAHILRQGVTAVVDLTGELSEAKPFVDAEYLPVPILDLTAPTQHQLDQIVRYIEQHTRSGVVYLHCKVGYSRTAAVAGAYLLFIGKAESVEEATTLLRHARAGMIIRPEARHALEEYHQRFTQRQAQSHPSPPLDSAVPASAIR